MTNILCSCSYIGFVNMFYYRKRDKIRVDIIYMLSLINKFDNSMYRYFHYNVVLWPPRLNLSTALSIDRWNILYTFWDFHIRGNMALLSCIKCIGWLFVTNMNENLTHYKVRLDSFSKSHVLMSKDSLDCMWYKRSIRGRIQDYTVDKLSLQRCNLHSYLKMLVDFRLFGTSSSKIKESVVILYSVKWTF